MDGNGRWAKQRNLPKIMGHRNGVKTAGDIVKACAERGVKALTMYTFSSENWKRPKEEVDALMALLEENLKKGINELHANNVRFNVIGRRKGLPLSLINEFDRAMALTSVNTGIVLSLAINYGGRQEIFDAACELAARVSDGRVKIDEIDEKKFGDLMYTKGLPELDLLIRTSGEMRISNFLLWQSAYTEIYVTDTLWPDFTSAELDKALAEFEKRERRYGG